jgi:hypothetical protein
MSAPGFVVAHDRRAMTPVQLHFPEWQREYLAALFELNPAKLRQRVMVAEFALRKRLLAIAQKQDGNGERQKIETALSNLRWRYWDDAA